MCTLESGWTDLHGMETDIKKDNNMLKIIYQMNRYGVIVEWKRILKKDKN